MIPTLYEIFQPWTKKGSLYIISDTHFDDHDCKIMDKNWITPKEHIDTIKQSAHKNDTLIHLGDVGNPEYLKEIKSYKVLIMGNHDEAPSRFKNYFDEIYTGPLMIAEKILLSHEPIENINWCLNIHGHDHNKRNKGDNFHINLASNVVNFTVFNLGKEIKKGILSHQKGIHRITIDEANKKSKKKNGF